MSNNITPAAADTFKDFIFPYIGIFTNSGEDFNAESAEHAEMICVEEMSFFLKNLRVLLRFPCVEKILSPRLRKLNFALAHHKSDLF